MVLYSRASSPITLFPGFRNRYLVSLDGVIQESCNENTVPDPDSNKSGGFVGGNGRKRKLLKPFKPPTRRAPPISTAVPPGDAWGSAGEMSQQRYARDRDNDDEVLPVRASFTGFGHVESLWENDDTNAEETALGSTPDGDCWINKDGDDRCINDQAFDGENIEAEERAIGAQGIRTSGVRLGSSMSDYLWRQEDHPAAVTSLPPTEESRADSQLTASKNYARSDAIEHRIDKRDGMGNAPENYSGGVVRREHLRDPRGRATWAISRETSGMTTEREAHGSARIDPHGYSLELSGDSPIRKDNRGRHWDPEGVSENVGGAHEPESGPGEENGDGEVRSTEDILSLFGGFGASNQPHPGETVGASKLLGSRQSTAKLAAEGHAINGRLHELRREGNTPQREGNTPPSGGGDLATGMRRAQQASQSTGWKDAGAAEVADASKAALDWSCEVCGVRASSASTSCRVCGTLAPGSGIEHKDDLGDGSVADEQDA